ncbi:hypothetical protein L2U69_04675 [Zavarzinia compransoris]|uniref:DUF2946 family protein n=1 Tax=Zavarzinia marina TaxID=2911065 RepID=UPI001F2E2209|nr:DUF2946 family protein [Zavarzinia marina]MCF4164931.1 hypothetical protein [Zavarzinia marina]
MRGKAAWLACLALLLQLVAPLSPMPAPRIQAGEMPTSLEGLAWALAANLCSTALPADDDGKAPGKSGQGCQICITTNLAGHFVAPLAPPLTFPAAFGRVDWRHQPLAPPRLAHAVGVQPRGPPPSV